MCINVVEHAVQNFAAIFSVFVFGRILKTSMVKLFIAIWKSCPNLLPYVESHKSTTIADKLMKYAGHLVMVVLIKSCGILKTAKKSTTLSCIGTLQLHYHRMG